MRYSVALLAVLLLWPHGVSSLVALKHRLSLICERRQGWRDAGRSIVMTRRDLSAGALELLST